MIHLSFVFFLMFVFHVKLIAGHVRRLLRTMGVKLPSFAGRSIDRIGGSTI